ncbi:Leucoanthocyanidin reductase [Nymphaea thermarum]|nr:Leucoanthocyanidin reductase [Nymphaea thermarum]
MADMVAKPSGRLNSAAAAAATTTALANGVPSNPIAGNILIIGAAGYIGKFVAEASLSAGRTTYILCRTGSISLSKAAAVQRLQKSGAIVLHGSQEDVELMTNLLKQYRIEIVISAVGGEAIPDQLLLIDAIKAAGSIKRFVPSEFGHDIDKANPIEPALTLYNQKRKIRRAIEAAGIPYTYVCCNSIAGWPYFDQIHPSEIPPPTDCFEIYGDGNVKAYFVAGEDIGKFTIKAADDVRTLNKVLHFRPQSNFVTLNEFASMWEKKIGKEVPRKFISEDCLLRLAEENRIPSSIVAALTHDIFINGCQFGFEIEGPQDTEVGRLYPDSPLIPLSHCLDAYLSNGVETGESSQRSGPL